jgi:hypothetical protein
VQSDNRVNRPHKNDPAEDSVVNHILRLQPELRAARAETTTKRGVSLLIRLCRNGAIRCALNEPNDPGDVIHRDLRLRSHEVQPRVSGMEKYSRLRIVHHPASPLLLEARIRTNLPAKVDERGGPSKAKFSQRDSPCSQAGQW